MLMLRPLQQIDAGEPEKVYHFLRSMPRNENGMSNARECCTGACFYEEALPQMLRFTAGKDLKPGHVPESIYLLTENGEIRGTFAAGITCHLHWRKEPVTSAAVFNGNIADAGWRPGD